MLFNRKTVFGQLDRRHQTLRQTQTPVLSGQMFHSRRHAGDTGGQRPVHRQARNHIALLIQIHIPMSRKGRFFPTIQHNVFTGSGMMQQPETATADAGAIGLHHGQRCRYRYRRIKGIAAGPENLLPRPGRQRMGTGNSGTLPCL